MWAGAGALLTRPPRPAATVPLRGTGDAWYEEVKAAVQQEQARPIWTAEDQVREGAGQGRAPGKGAGLGGGPGAEEGVSRAEGRVRGGARRARNRGGAERRVQGRGAGCGCARGRGLGGVPREEGRVGGGTGTCPGLGLGAARGLTASHPQLDGSSEDLELPGRGLDASSGDLSCDSRANSDCEDTDGVYTDGEGGVYTDGEGGGPHDPHDPQDAEEEPALPALARSSEPAWVEAHEGLRGHGATAAEWETQVRAAPGWGPPCVRGPPRPRTLPTGVSAGPSLPCRPGAATRRASGARTACGECPRHPTAAPRPPAQPGLGDRAPSGGGFPTHGHWAGASSAPESHGVGVGPGEVPPRTPHRGPAPLRPRTYEREALRRKFTRARDAESSDEGYDWGPATDL